jgi:Lhr-like helicase
MRLRFSLLYVSLVLLVVSTTDRVWAQAPAQTRQAVVHQGDTIPYIELPTIRFFAPRVFTSRQEEARYLRLVRNVKRVYPYAKLAGVKFDEYSQMLSGIKSESEKKRITKNIEQQIRTEFEGELRKLTITQGHILIKLIDRQTQHSSYDVLKDFRGTLTAVFWQSFGRLFGYNLKNKYDPNGEDWLIEEIVRMIEAGVI